MTETTEKQYADPMDLTTVRFTIREYTLKLGENIGHMQMHELPHNASCTGVVFVDGVLRMSQYVHTNMNPEDFPPQKHGYVVHRTGDVLAYEPGEANFMATIWGAGVLWHVFELKVDPETGLRKSDVPETPEPASDPEAKA